MVTIDEIAERLGVSRSTVSNALSGNRHVAPSTVERVRKLCDELGYRPNLAARSLRTRKTGVVGVVVPNITEPYLARQVVAIERSLKQAGYQMLLGNYEFDVDDEQQIIERFLSFRIDGIVVLSGLDTQIPRYIRVAGDTPVVFVDKEWDTDQVGIIDVNHFEAAADAVSYLAGHGHRDIVHLTIPHDDFSVIRVRAQGFRTGLERVGIPFRPEMLIVEPAIRLNEINTSLKLAERIAASNATAVFVVSDYVAVGLAKGLTSLGVGVPEDISIIGVGNIDYCKVTTPTLSSIDLSVSDCAATAVEVLDGMINDLAIATRRTIRHRIVERESVQPPRA